MSQKRFLFGAALLLAFFTTTHAKIVHLLPKPQKITTGTGSLSFPEKIRFNAAQSDRITAAFSNMLGVQVTDEASATPVSINIGQTISGAYNYRLNGYDNEAYRLTVATSGITIDATTETGVLRAVQTLVQLGEGYDGEAAALECCTITDWPAFKLRGLMHDIGRSYITFEELKKQIKLMARFKVNTFHFHLTENQGWRFEVKQYPKLTQASSMTRFAGKYYTQEQCRELDSLAYLYGIAVIPEIDMPGHSGAFERAMGHSMQTEQGVAELKNILTEVVAAFPRAPYIHIGADEVEIKYPNFLKIMTDHLHGLNKKVVFWNPIRGVAINTSSGADMTQMWSSNGRVISGMPNIDCRYNYINHFDLFADVVGIYKSNIYYAQKGSTDIAGTITAVWNDRYIAEEARIMNENNVYASLLASAERAWSGGGKQYIETGGTTLPTSGEEFDEFADWERRFLFHKAHSLKNEPIPYVKQTNVRWQITDAFPNGGNSATVLPPETLGPQRSYTYQGATYGTGSAVGAGIYLRHVWGGYVPAYFANPQINTTAYAWTYVYSPVEQEAGAIIEFQNYSRSEKDGLPNNYSWDKKGSRIWFNDVEIRGPKWDNAGISINNETPMKNENAASRPPVAITLKQGWNKVFMKLPYVNVSGIRLNKWMFTFVITDKEGKNALEGLTYSPKQLLDENGNALAERIDEILSLVDKRIGTEPGFYREGLETPLLAVISELQATFDTTLSENERNQQIARLNAAYDAFLDACNAEGPIIPTASTGSEEHWYTFCSTLRNSRYTYNNGAGSGVTGRDNTESDQMYWKIVRRSDGTFDIINRADGSYLSPDAAYNTQIKTTATRPSKGWTFKASGTVGMLIITCGDVQLNQTNLNNAVYNWSSQSSLGNDQTDTGCQFTIREVFPPSENDATVRVADTSQSIPPTTYGSWDGTPWTKGWTSNETSGKAGLRITSETAQFDQAVDYQRYGFSIKPSGVGATDVITITAPEGYVITGYSMQVRLWTAHEPYTLNNDWQSVSPVTNSWMTFGAQNLREESTSFTITATGSTNNRYLCVTDFTVTLSPKTTTEIQHFDLETAQNDVAIYDLSGRRIHRVSTLPKGIYIRGNKKFVVK